MGRSPCGADRAAAGRSTTLQRPFALGLVGLCSSWPGRWFCCPGDAADRSTGQIMFCVYGLQTVRRRPAVSTLSGLACAVPNLAVAAVSVRPGLRGPAMQSMVSVWFRRELPRAIAGVRRCWRRRPVGPPWRCSIIRRGQTDASRSCHSCFAFLGPAIASAPRRGTARRDHAVARDRRHQVWRRSRSSGAISLEIVGAVGGNHRAPPIFARDILDVGARARLRSRAGGGRPSSESRWRVAAYRNVPSSTCSLCRPFGRHDVSGFRRIRLSCSRWPCWRGG